eukprot:7055984-Prymnesium_polylepis.1
MRARTLALGGWMVQGGAMWGIPMSALADATRGGGDGECSRAGRPAKRWLVRGGVWEVDEKSPGPQWPR